MEKQQEERVDDLQYKGLKIIQNRNGFCFGIDAVLLSDFAKEIKKGSNIIDLGTGTGIVGMLVCAKTQPSKMIGVEIQEEVCQMARRSIQMNHLEDVFSIICDDICHLTSHLELEAFDAVITNPPYQKCNTGICNENEIKRISRHEGSATLEDFICISAQLLKPKKDLYMVHRPNRLVDIMALLRKYQLEPKRLQLVHPKLGEKPNLVLVKATKQAKPFLTIEKPLYVYQKNGEYTEDILTIYGKK